MDLTETEKAAFAVLFEKNETETGACYREMRLAKKAMSDEPTEEEYKNAVEVARIQMLKIAQLRADYLEKLEKIMPAKKIYKLYEAEEAYKNNRASVDMCKLVVRTRADSHPKFSDMRYAYADVCGSQIITTDYPPRDVRTDEHTYTFDGYTVKLLK